jgi:hypothetical protein
MIPYLEKTFHNLKSKKSMKWGLLGTEW